MSQRSGYTKWLWCLFAMYMGPGWGRAVSVRTPPKNPTTVEAQAKFFQDFFSVQLSPYKIEFGHVCEDPNTWEQRYEKKDFENHRDMGKVQTPYTMRDEFNGFLVRWGDKQGGYGEHYWDLNHAGHADNHGNDEYDHDDGSYNHDLDHAHEDHDSYDEPSEQLPSYGTDEYDPEKAAKYDESGRAKRHHPRIKTERKHVGEEDTFEEQPKPQKYRINERSQAAPTQQVEKKEIAEEHNEPPKRKRRQRKPGHVEEETVEKETGNKEEPTRKKESNHKKEQHQEQRPQYYVNRPEKQFAPHEEETNHKKEQNQEQRPQYYVNRPEKQFVPHEEETNHKKEPNQEQRPQYYVNRPEKQFVPHEEETNHKNEQNQEQRPQYYVNRPETQFVPYEQGAGVRQHHPSEITPAASVPRLFLEPTTGHVVDRATGQAYVLQPISYQ